MTFVTNWRVPCRDLEAEPKELLQEMFVSVGQQRSKPGWHPQLPSVDRSLKLFVGNQNRELLAHTPLVISHRKKS